MMIAEDWWAIGDGAHDCSHALKIAPLTIDKSLTIACSCSPSPTIADHP
ncbi:hypothetical protein KY495_00545 [Massilia sp. PAMC28688]|nr:hypothetical protein [Massilia sp. PAMC28688]QYF93766.1 hypothetical protein KY495_00545 [Massilia sp. PAMC28688]